MHPLDGESPRAYEAFRAYLELGPGRRYAAVAQKVGAGLRTVKTWAHDHQWRNRIKAHSAACAGRCSDLEIAARREEFSSASERARIHARVQNRIADTLLEAAQSYLENADFDDLDSMSFTDACKAINLASRLLERARKIEPEDTSAFSDSVLATQLTSPLDQVCLDKEVPFSAKPESLAPAAGGCDVSNSFPL